MRKIIAHGHDHESSWTLMEDVGDIAKDPKKAGGGCLTVIIIGAALAYFIGLELTLGIGFGILAFIVTCGALAAPIVSKPTNIWLVLLLTLILGPIGSAIAHRNIRSFFIWFFDVLSAFLITLAAFFILPYWPELGDKIAALPDWAFIASGVVWAALLQWLRALIQR